MAIIMVMIWHLRTLDGNRLVTGFLGDSCIWGVDLFFVLSGYLIGYQLFQKYLSSQKIYLKEFYFRRILRTWPNFLFVLCLYLLIPGFKELPEMPPLWRFLTFTQNFNLSFSAFSNAWSLCIEEQFYLLLPVIVIFYLKIQNRFLTFGTIFGILIFSFLYRLSILNGADHITTNEYFKLIYYPTWGRLDGLVLGVSIALVRSFWPYLWEVITKKSNYFLLFGLCTLFLGFYLQLNRQSHEAILFGFPLVSLGFAFIVVSSLSKDSVFAKFKLPGAKIIATLSFSLYLIHKPVFHLVGNFFSATENPWLFTVICFGASILAATVLYLLIEKPFLDLRNKRGLRCQPLDVA